MKTILVYIFSVLTFVQLSFLPNSFAQGALSQPSVKLVYFLPNDRPARPDRIAAIRQMIKDTQRFYADEMERHGYGRKTFRVETGSDGKPVVHRFNGRFNEDYYYEPLTDYKVWDEVFKRFDDSQHIYYIFMDMGREVLDGGNSCGLGGAIFFPSNVADPAFSFGSVAIRHRDKTPAEELLGGSAMSPVSGHCFDIRLITHEFGHAFGLEHDFREGRDTIIMSGWGSRLSAAAAEWLSVSRFFNSSTISNNSSGNIQLSSPPTYSSEGVNVRFEVADADGLHQAQLLVPDILRDGSSWGPYRLFDAKRLNGETKTTVEFISDALTVEPVDRITLQTIDVNGNIAWATIPVDIASVVPPPKVVSIPDPNLAAAIRVQLGLGPRDRITDYTMRRLTSLSVSDQGITNIAGLEYATQLTRLSLGRNQINRFDQLAQLSKLTTLYLWANGINDLSVLPPMPQLEFLDLNWNRISDLSPLAEFTNLRELWLQGNNLTDTSTLFKLHNGTFPPDEEVEVVKKQDRSNREYTLLIFQSLDLKVRINPDVIVFQSLNSLQELQQSVLVTDVPIDTSVSATNVTVGAAQRPPMYWVDTDNDTLHRLVGNEVENLLPNVQNATSLAIDMMGEKLYWTERTSNRTGRIRRSNLDGTNAQLVKELTSMPLDIALDSVGQKLYVTNAWGKVQRLNLDGSNFQPNLITNLDTPKSLALDASGGKIYWIEQIGKRSGKIQRANLDGTEVQLVKALTSLPRGIALNNTSRKIYVTNAYGKVQRLNFAGFNYQPNLITDLDSPEGIVVDGVSGKLYWTEQGGIHRANLNGKNIQSVITGLDAPGNIVLGIMQPDVTLGAAPATVTVIPDETDLRANYPNPFNPETWIPYQLSEPAAVTLRIYGIDGRLLRTLSLGHQPAGIYQSRHRAAYWDGRNELGETVASGVYFYTVFIGDFTATRKMLIRK